MSTQTELETQSAAAIANLVTHAIGLERGLTEEDYATKSEALQTCAKAWEVVRRAGGWP